MTVDFYIPGPILRGFDWIPERPYNRPFSAAGGLILATSDDDRAVRSCGWQARNKH